MHHQKLGIILENKVAQKLKLSKMSTFGMTDIFQCEKKSERCG
jgi:hypothetical protein